MRERVNLRKAAATSVVLNALQILAVVGMLALLLTAGVNAANLLTLEIAMVAAAIVVCWGAIVDIQEARSAVRTREQAEALAQTHEQLEQLNRTLRSQRHDFMNHLQVVYSLTEMGERQETLDYIERVHGDLQRVSRSLRTASPAINALLQAKITDCEKRGIHVQVNISSQWENLPMPSWEMCRVLGNLIDNAMEILHACKEPSLTIVLYSDVKHLRFRVENNGEMIPPAALPRIFEAGFTTKGEGHGMGLHIVREILRQYGGDISVISDQRRTAFEGFVPFGQNKSVDKT